MTTITGCWPNDTSSIGASWDSPSSAVVVAKIGSKEMARSSSQCCWVGSVGGLGQNTGYDIYVNGAGPCGANTLANSRTTIFAQRFPARQKDACGCNPPSASLSLVGRLAIADLLIKLSLSLESHLSIAPRHVPVDQPVASPLFDLLVTQTDFNRNVVNHYVRRGTRGDWKRVDTLVLPDGEYVPDNAVANIQSFRAQEHLDALAWHLPRGILVTFEYASDTGEHKSIPVVAEDGPIIRVNGKPALVQTDQGAFNLLVPRLSSDGRQEIVHLIHPSETMQGSWKQVATLPVPEGGSVISVAAVQADSLGSLKAVARIRLSGEPDFLGSYYYPGPNFNWVGPVDPIINVSGSPGFVQSISDDEKESLNLLAPIVDPNTGNIVLTQFTQPAIKQGFEIWKPVATLPPLNENSRTQVISASLIQDSDHNLQAIANVITSNGENLLVFYIFTPQTGWSAPSIVTSGGQPIIVGSFASPIPSLVSLTLNPATAGGLTDKFSTGTVTLSAPAPSGGELINLVSQNPQGYPKLVTVPASVTVVQGQTTATFQASIGYNPNPPDSVSVVISASLAGVTQPATLTVVGQIA